MKYIHYAVCAAILLFLVAPVLVVVPISFSASPYLEFPPSGWSLRWYAEFFSSNTWSAAMITSFRVAIITMILTVVLATSAALAFHKGVLRNNGVTYAILMSPMIVPHIVVAVAAYGWLSQLGLVGTTAGLVSIYIAFAMPFSLLIIRSNLEGTDKSLERAALNLGATKVQAFWRIVLPCISSGIFVAALFAFIIAFDELVVALFVSGTSATTLPKRMWDGLQSEINPTIASASTILIGVSFLLFGLAECVRKRTSVKSQTVLPHL